MEKTDRENFPVASDEQPEIQKSEGGEDTTALLAKLQEKEAEAKANYELFLRERAELENFKRRMLREQAESLRFANEPLLRDLLPAIDNLERAVEHARGGGNGQPLVEGVALVLRSFLDTLEKYGVSRLTVKGEPFDPNKHEAIAQVESADVTPSTVVSEHHPGYLLHGRLLRPALVTVAKAPAEEKEGKKSDE
jgi:molecular chaperone GrpE